VKRPILISLVLLALTSASAVAGSTPTHQGQLQRVGLSFSTNASKSHMSTRLVPGYATQMQSFVTFNGHQPQACWNDTPLEFECAWHGVLVVVVMPRKVGHMTVRVASARADRVAVRAGVTWR